MSIYRIVVGLVAVASLAACTSTTQGQANPSSAPDQLVARSGTVEPTPAPLDAEIAGTVVLGKGQSRSCDNPKENEARLTIATGHSENGSGYQEVHSHGGVIGWEFTAGSPGNADMARVLFEGTLKPRAIIVNSQKAASLVGVEAGTLEITGEQFGDNGQIYGATVCF